jgi:Uma2 family endonuclease
MRVPDAELKRWTRIEYERLVDKGVLGPGDKIELIDGLMLVAEPQSSEHFTAIRLVALALSRVFGEGWDIRTEGPIALDEDSEPEPDVAVVRGAPRDYADAHPADPVLVVEVALTSGRFDRTEKSGLYARAGRPDYWILDLVERRLEIRREPAPVPATAYGWEYTAVTVHDAAADVSPLAAPTARIRVADLLP